MFRSTIKRIRTLFKRAKAAKVTHSTVCEFTDSKMVTSTLSTHKMEDLFHSSLSLIALPSTSEIPLPPSITSSETTAYPEGLERLPSAQPATHKSSSVCTLTSAESEVAAMYSATYEKLKISSSATCTRHECTITIVRASSHGSSSHGTETPKCRFCGRTLTVHTAGSMPQIAEGTSIRYCSDSSCLAYNVKSCQSPPRLYPIFLRNRARRERMVERKSRSDREDLLIRLTQNSYKRLCENAIQANELKTKLPELTSSNGLADAMQACDRLLMRRLMLEGDMKIYCLSLKLLADRPRRLEKLTSKAEITLDNTQCQLLLDATSSNITNAQASGKTRRRGRAASFLEKMTCITGATGPQQ